MPTKILTGSLFCGVNLFSSFIILSLCSHIDALLAELIRWPAFGFGFCPIAIILSFLLSPTTTLPPKSPPPPLAHKLSPHPHRSYFLIFNEQLASKEIIVFTKDNCSYLNIYSYMGMALEMGTEPSGISFLNISWLFVSSRSSL